jgi:predicted TPR repeat methyltransferase
MTVSDRGGGTLDQSQRRLRTFDVRFPDGARGAQDEEWCEVHIDGRVERIRFHDYAEVYSIPGLYEQIFYTELKCCSPEVIRELIADHLRQEGLRGSDLAVIDVGAGNGMVGEELASIGAGALVGVDIIEEAAMAAERDRPGVYDDYFVVDLTNIPPNVYRKLAERRFTCLTTVAALGFGDIPPLAFANAYNLVEPGGVIAFNIKDKFLGERDGSGFSRLIQHMLEHGVLELRHERRYRHRMSVAGEPLHYVAMVATKRADVPRAWARSAG